MEAASCQSFKKWFHTEMKINSTYLANNTKEKEQLVAVGTLEWATWAWEAATMTQMYLLVTR